MPAESDPKGDWRRPLADLPAALGAELRADGDVVAVHALHRRDHVVPAVRAELRPLRDERVALRAVRALFHWRAARAAELHRGRVHRAALRARLLRGRRGLLRLLHLAHLPGHLA